MEDEPYWFGIQIPIKRQRNIPVMSEKILNNVFVMAVRPQALFSS